MRLQAASRKEVSRIAVGVLVCNVVMVAALFLLSQLGVGKFEVGKILIGAAVGSVIAIVNFIILCLTIQSALGIENKRRMKARFQTSYNIRLLIQAAWIVACFFLREKIHFFAAAAPVFYPNIWLVYLQLTGRLNTGAPAPEASPEADGSQQ
ncbi:MAG: ATP synthase subunit I [Oscillospiraceae bacterium]|nr:ATP synthase subunit I [Oscillospiraceae bacterium]